MLRLAQYTHKIHFPLLPRVWCDRSIKEETLVCCLVHSMQLWMGNTYVINEQMPVLRLLHCYDSLLGIAVGADDYPAM